MRAKPVVVIGLLGPTLDAGGPERWERWRPTVSLCQHENFVVNRLELLFQRKFTALAETIVADIATTSPETAVRLHQLEFENPWDLEEVYGALHDYARGYRFDVEEEEYLIHITTGTHIAQICMFLLTEAHYFPAKLIQTSPPSRQSGGGPGKFEIIDLDLSKYDKLAARFRQEQRDAVSFLKSGIETRSANYNRLIDRIEKVAIASREPLLLIGPTGAGKSRLARRIYELKRARHQIRGPFVDVNCATLTGEGAMSALFGHVKGAFTGAVRDRPGLLLTANEGVLFLDEIGCLGLDEQAMLLRALEEKVFLPLGGDRETKSNFQLIAGTNADLKEMVRDGRFRHDLLARINLWTFQLPGLRERVEDIEPNLQYELGLYAERASSRITFNKEARDRFLRFATSAKAHWAGNFRDLNGAVIRMATLAEGGRISVAVVDEEIARLKKAWTSLQEEDKTDESVQGLIGKEAWAGLDLFDRIQLKGVLHVCRQSRTLSEAGRKLFSISRDQKKTTNDADRLRKYLARFGLDWERIRPD
jgi:transcriptional regulatory protein RtcR